jgi:hypothetical protein
MGYCAVIHFLLCSDGKGEIMQKVEFWILILLLLMIAGCVEAEGITYTPPALGDDWSVKMRLSGGFAGMLRIIEVRADGEYSVADGRTGKTAAGRLAEDELAELKNLIAALEFTAPRMPSSCADCFVYDVQIQSAGRKMTLHADDVTLNDSGMEGLALFLRGLMDSALSR